MLIYAILATVFVSLISLAGVLTIFRNADKNTIVLRRLIGLAVGTLLAVVFFDLLPEAIEKSQNTLETTLLIVFASILTFFVIEKIIHYHHCHCDEETKAKKKTHLIVNNLVGDGLHNFIDGALIGGAFLVDLRLGVVTTLAVALHEIPQEITDFSILIYGGLSRARAIFFNLLFALSSVLGAVLVFFIAEKVDALIPVLLAIAAGNFIYLGLADLLPELHREEEAKRVAPQIFWVGLGILIIYLAGRFGGQV